MKDELKAAVQATESHLVDICGIGPAGAARILADVSDVSRVPNRSHFASWTGTAPIDASSAQHIRHRLSRAGNRRYDDATGDQHVAIWPPAREFVRPAPPPSAWENPNP
jgi:transposase